MSRQTRARASTALFVTPNRCFVTRFDRRARLSSTISAFGLSIQKMAAKPVQRTAFRTIVSAILSGLVALPMQTRAQDPANPTVTVTVKAKKQAVVRKLDKTVYDVANMPRAANGSAQDVLQSTPEVSVTADGKIAVKGNSQVTVLVNGQPTAMMSGALEERAAALQTMSGADIASIEVITNPSAAYHANGGAILNIVLKRNRKPGTHAQVQGSATDQGLWNVGSSADVTRKHISVHGTLAFRHDGTLKLRQSEVDWNNPVSGQTGQTLQSSRVFVRRVVQSAALGVDDAISDRDSLSLSARYNERRSLPVFDVLNEDRTGAARTIYHRISNGPNQQSDDSASLSFSHRDDGTALKAMVQRSDTIGLIDKSYRDVFVEPARATDYSHGANKSRRHLNQATVDWSRLSEHGQWGAGLDIRDHVDDIDNYQASVDSSSGAETPDSNTTNGYAVTTTLSAAYLTDKIRRGKWEALLGGRAEHMALRVNPAVGAVQSKHWQALNPSLHLRYAFSDHSDLTLSYRRSLQTPDPRDLNPFTTYVDAQNLSRGNPGLKPQRLTSWEIGTNADVARLSGNVSAFYRISRDTVIDTRSFADNVLITSKQNGGQARSAGITGSLDWTPDAKLHFGVDGGIYRVMLDTPDLAGPVRQDGISGYIKLRAAYSAAHDDVSLDAHGQSRRITPLGRYGATSSVNLTWKHHLSKTLSLTVNANDIVDGSLRNYRTDTSTFRQTGFDHFVARRIYVGFVKQIE
jgi:outer membrane receptor protein involved in Fe transport